MLLRKRQKDFVEAAAAYRGDSPSALLWKRFRRNGMAMTSLVIISLFTLVALLGYLITPDHTPHCNQQYLELASLKPLSKASFLCIPFETENGERRAENGERRTENGKRRTESGERRAENGERRAENGERRAESGERRTESGERKTENGLAIINGKPLDYVAIPVEKYSISGDSIRAVPYNGDPIVASSGDAYIQRRTFLLGTDTYGRDLLSQVMIGSRVSLSIGFIAVAIALLIGILLGSLAAFYGGWVDNIVMWFINVVWSIPTVLLVIAITFALGKGFWQVFVAVGLTMWVDVARVVRGQVLSVKENEYVEAARALGYSTPRIILRHIMPNITGPVIVIAASNFASAILLEAGLSFLGIGVQPPMPSWGTMVKENYGQILLDNAHLAFIPGIAIMVIVLAFMLLANGIRDALDIKESGENS